jgi:hypothetical protein
MTILLPALGVAFAASCVWLTVLIVNRREAWAKCALAAVLFAGLVVYPLSFGPVVWLYDRQMLPDGIDDEALICAYRPLEQLALYGPTPVSKALGWYERVWRGF